MDSEGSLSVVRELTKTVDQRRVLTEQGKFFYKTALSEIVTLLNRSLDPNYYVSESITVAADIQYYKGLSEIGGHVDTIDSTNNIIDMTVYINPGTLIHVETHQSTGIVSGRWSGRVTGYRLNTGDTPPGSGYDVSYSVIDGTDADYDQAATEFCTIYAYSSWQLATFDTATLVYSVDQIDTIVDSVYGQCVKVSLKEFHSISRGTFQHKSYEDDIIWTQAGNIIYFRNGGKITSPGTKTIYYQRQPEYPTSFNDSEYVDLADKWVPLLIKRIYTYMILQTENDVPKNLAQEMQMDYQAIADYANSELNNRQKPVSNSQHQQNTRQKEVQ